MPASRFLAVLVGVPVLLLLVAQSARAADWFVDNRTGDDLYDGRLAITADVRSGPVKTISRALEHVQPGDAVHIANHGIPYFESLQAVGSRFTGVTIEGNGAVVSGAKIVPFEAWKYMGNDTWRFIPRRKTFYQLVSGDRAVPEHPCPPDSSGIPEVPAGHWCAWRGSVFYHLLPGTSQHDDPLMFAAEEVGITLYDAHDVTIHNLEVRHFRLDGVNAPDRSRNVVLDSVRLIENGRAGLAVGGSSLIGIKDSKLEGNRVVQILNAEVAQTEILTSTLGPAAWGPIRIKGGHVLVEGQEILESPK